MTKTTAAQHDMNTLDSFLDDVQENLAANEKDRYMGPVSANRIVTGIVIGCAFVVEATLLAMQVSPKVDRYVRSRLPTFDRNQQEMLRKLSPAHLPNTFTASYTVE